MMKETSKMVYMCVKAHDGENITAQDIANETGLPIKSVNGIVTQSFCRHKDENKNPEPLMERIPAEAVDPDTGLHRPIKLIRLTDAGRAFDIEAACAPEEEDD